MAAVDAAGLEWWKACFGEAADVPLDHFAARFAAKLKGACPEAALARIAAYVVAQDGKRVVHKTLFESFLQQFAPFDQSAQLCHRNLFDSNGLLFPWYHGTQTGRQEALGLCRKSGQYLVRVSDSNPDKLALVASKIKEGQLATKNVLIERANGHYMVRERTGLGQPFPTLSELLRSLGELVEPVPSPIFVRMKNDLPRQEAEAKSHGGGYSTFAPGAQQEHHGAGAYAALGVEQQQGSVNAYGAMTAAEDSGAAHGYNAMGGAEAGAHSYNAVGDGYSGVKAGGDDDLVPDQDLGKALERVLSLEKK